MEEALELLALLMIYSVLVVHALAGVVLMLPGSLQCDAGPREGM